MTNSKSGECNNFNLIQFIWKWRKWFIISCLAAGIIAFVATLFIRPQYESVAIIYAPRTNSVSKILLTEHDHNERLDIKAYAVEEETEQMIQLLRSRDLFKVIIEKFNLIAHYGIDTTKMGWYNKLYNITERSIMVNRTSFGAISITVHDIDPQIAADIANEMLVQLDTFKNNMERQRAAAAYALLEQQLAEINAEIDRTNDSLELLMQYGVFDFERQSDRLMQQHAIAVAQGNAAAINRLEAELKNLATWGPKTENLREHLMLFRQYQSFCKGKLMNAKIDMESQMPTKFEVQRAQPDDKKVYPKKAIITIVAVVSVFILLLVVLLIIENIKNMGHASVAQTSEEETV